MKAVNTVTPKSRASVQSASVAESSPVVVNPVFWGLKSGFLKSKSAGKKQAESQIEHAASNESSGSGASITTSSSVAEPSSVVMNPVFGGLKSGFLKSQSAEKKEIVPQLDDTVSNDSFSSGSITTSSFVSGNSASSSSIGYSLTPGDLCLDSSMSIPSPASSSIGVSSAVLGEREINSSPPSLLSQISSEDTSVSQFASFSFVYFKILDYLPDFYEKFNRCNADPQDDVYLTWPQALEALITKDFLQQYIIETLWQMPSNRFCLQQTGRLSLATCVMEFFNVVSAYDLKQYQKIAKFLIAKFINKYQKDYPLVKVVDLCDINLYKLVTARPESRANRQQKLHNLKRLKSVVILEILCKFALQKEGVTDASYLDFLDVVPFLRRPLLVGLLDEYTYIDAQTSKSFSAQEILKNHQFLGTFLNSQGAYGKIIKADLHQYTQEEEEKRAFMSAKYANIPHYENFNLTYRELSKKISESLDVKVIGALLGEFKDWAFWYETYDRMFMHNRFFLDNFAAFLGFKIDLSDFSLANIFFINEVFLSACSASIVAYVTILQHDEIANYDAIKQRLLAAKNSKFSLETWMENARREAGLTVIFLPILCVLSFYEVHLLSMYARMDIEQLDEQGLTQLIDCLSFQQMLDYLYKVTVQVIGGVSVLQNADSNINIKDLERVRSSSLFRVQKHKLLQKRIWERVAALSDLGGVEDSARDVTKQNFKAEWARFRELMVSLAEKEYVARKEKERKMAEILKKRQEALKKRAEAEQNKAKSAAKKPKSHGKQQAKSQKSAKKDKKSEDFLPDNAHTALLKEIIEKLIIENAQPAFLKDTLKQLVTILDEDLFKIQGLDAEFSGICYNIEIVLKYIADCLEKNFLKKIKKYQSHMHDLVAYGISDAIKIKEASKYFAEHTEELRNIMQEAVVFIDKSKYMLSFVCDLVLQDMPKDVQDIERYLTDNLALKRIIMLYEDVVVPLNLRIDEYHILFIDNDLINRCLTKLNSLIDDLQNKKAVLAAIFARVKYEQNFGFRPKGLPPKPNAQSLKEVTSKTDNNLNIALEVKANLKKLQEDTVSQSSTFTGADLSLEEELDSKEEEVFMHDPYHYEIEIQKTEQASCELKQVFAEINSYKVSLAGLKRQFNFVCGDERLKSEDISAWIAKANN